MSTAKLITSTLVVSIVLFLLNFIWYMFLFPDAMMPEGLGKEPPDYMWLVIGTLILGFLFSYIYPMMAGDGGKVPEGLKYGVLMGLIISLPSALMGYATWEVATLGEWITDTFRALIIFALAGVALAFVSGIPDGIPDRGPGREPDVE